MDESEFDKGFESVIAWLVDKDSRVKTVGPSSIGRCGQLFSLKQLIAVLKSLIHRDNFSITVNIQFIHQTSWQNLKLRYIDNIFREELVCFLCFGTVND